jgi:GNAT superfamily N-acetyltransferase
MHLGRLRDEWVSGANRFDRRGEGLYLGETGDRAVAVCGLNVDPYAGDPRVGRLRRLYVLESCRRHGVGRALVHHAIGEAGRAFREVRLRTHDEAADAFYRALGFARVLDVEGCTHALRLDP